MFFMVAIHHRKTFRNGECPPYVLLNLVESHHMVNIHHYLLYDCSCNGLPASEGPDTRVYGSNSNLWKKRWMYTIFVILSFSRFISCSYSFWWSYLCFTEQQSCRWCHHSFWQVWPPWPSPWPPSTPPSSFYNKWRFSQLQAHAAAATLQVDPTRQRDFTTTFVAQLVRRSNPFCTTLCWAIATHCCMTLFCSCTNSETVIGPTILWSRRRFYLKRDTRRNICQGKRSTSGSRTSGCCAWGRRRAALQKLEERGTWSSRTRACHTAPESVKRVKSSA